MISQLPLLLLVVGLPAGWSAEQPYSAIIECSSNSFKPAQCAVPNNVLLQSVSVASQLSKSPCTLDVTFGITADKQGVWVTNGCRARFAVAGIQLDSSLTTVNVVCSSNNFKPAQCYPGGGVVLTSVSVVHQLSRSSCIKDVTFGITSDGRGVWVTNGCRAVFSAVVA